MKVGSRTTPEDINVVVSINEHFAYAFQNLSEDEQSLISLGVTQAIQTLIRASPEERESILENLFQL